jgi:hypothetical protein
MVFNLFGIIYLLIQAILINKNLGLYHYELDSEAITPSDFALIVRKIPLHITSEELRQ